MATFVIDIERKRGDTKRITFTVKALVLDPVTNKNVLTVVDISGWSDFLMTIDPSKAPTDALGNLGQVTGALLTDGLDGKMFFIPTGTIAVGKHFYDVQALDDNGEKSTVVEGKYTLIQDITKD